MKCLMPHVWMASASDTDAQGQERRTLGGSWWYGPRQMAAVAVAWKPADFCAVCIGFRCVHPAAAK